MMHQLLLLHPYLAYLFIGVFTLAIGSLLNVFIYRLPLMLNSEWTSQCRTLLNLPETEEESINLFLPRSFCPFCKHMVRAWQNIPLLSFCILKGRCAQCHHPISWQYPLIECICMGLSCFAVFKFGFNETLLYALLFIWILICLCMIDLKHQLLPDCLVLSLLWLGLIANAHNKIGRAHV